MAWSPDFDQDTSMVWVVKKNTPHHLTSDATGDNFSLDFFLFKLVRRQYYKIRGFAASVLRKSLELSIYLGPEGNTDLLEDFE